MIHTHTFLIELLSNWRRLMFYKNIYWKRKFFCWSIYFIEYDVKHDLTFKKITIYSFILNGMFMYRLCNRDPHIIVVDFAYAILLFFIYQRSMYYWMLIILTIVKGMQSILGGKNITIKWKIFKLYFKQQRWRECKCKVTKKKSKKKLF